MLAKITQLLRIWPALIQCGLSAAADMSTDIKALSKTTYSNWVQQDISKPIFRTTTIFYISTVVCEKVKRTHYPLVVKKSGIL